MGVMPRVPKMMNNVRNDDGITLPSSPCAPNVRVTIAMMAGIAMMVMITHAPLPATAELPGQVKGIGLADHQEALPAVVLATSANVTRNSFAAHQKSHAAGVQGDCTPNGKQRDYNGQCVAATDIGNIMPTWFPLLNNAISSSNVRFHAPLVLSLGFNIIGCAIYWPIQNVVQRADKATLTLTGATDQNDLLWFQLWEDDRTIFHGEWPLDAVLPATTFTKKGTGKWNVGVVNWSTDLTVRNKPPPPSDDWSLDLECNNGAAFEGSPKMCPLCTAGLQKSLNGGCQDRGAATDATALLTYPYLSPTKDTATAAMTGGTFTGLSHIQFTLHQADKATLTITADATQAAELYVQVWEDGTDHFHGEWPLKDALAATSFDKKGSGSWSVSLVVWSTADVSVQAIAANTVTVDLECVAAGTEFMGTPKACGVPAPVVPESLPTCAYSAIGFNPWERWQFFASEGDSEHGSSAEIEGRVAAHNFKYGSGSKLHTKAEPYIEAGKRHTDNKWYSVSVSGNYLQTETTTLLNGGVEAVGDIELCCTSEIAGDAKSVSGKVNVHSMGTLSGTIYSFGDFVLRGSSKVNGDVHTNGVARTHESGTVSGNMYAGLDLTVEEGAKVMGSAHAGRDGTITTNGLISGDFKAATLLIEQGGTLNGNCVTSTAAVIGDGGTIKGQQTVDAVAPPPPISPALTVDLSVAAAYFKSKSVEWSQESDCVVSVTIPASDTVDPSLRILKIKLHGKVNYLSSVTKEQIVFATKIVLTGHPDGILIWNMPGTDYSTSQLQYKKVWYEDKAGTLSEIAYGRVLFNFYEATTLSIGLMHHCNGADCTGGFQSVSILAPLADVDAGNSAPINLKGNVISKTFKTGGSSKFKLMPFGAKTASPRTLGKRNKGACLWHTL